MSGHLALVGGGEFAEGCSFDASLLEASGGDTVLVVPTAAAYDVDEATGERVALAVRDALFEHGRDIADRAVLAEIAEAHGVALPEPGHHEAVVAEWEAGQAAGVVGSPHFLVGGDGFFCPGLDIRHDDDGFHIERDVAAFGAFLDEAFG